MVIPIKYIEWTGGLRFFGWPAGGLRDKGNQGYLFPVCNKGSG